MSDDDLFDDLDAKYGGGRTTTITGDEDLTDVVEALAGVPLHKSANPAPIQRAEPDPEPDDGRDTPDDRGAIQPISTRYGTYRGPRLTPSRAMCGWCSTRQCGGCHTWMRSPGTEASKRYNDELPCIHPCDEEKLVYLRSIFGERWEPTHPIPTRHAPVLRGTAGSSNVPEVTVLTNTSPTTEEIAVSDTTTETIPTETTEDFAVYDATEGTVAVEPTGAAAAPEPQPEGDTAADEAPVTAEPAVAEPTDGEKPKRKPRTDLEPEVKKVTDAFVTGALSLAEGEFLTPHRIGKQIAANRGEGADTPSTGAVSSVLDRWETYGFAVLNPKPKAFSDYTDAGREKGLTAMKEAHRAAKRAGADAS